MGPGLWAARGGVREPSATSLAGKGNHRPTSVESFCLSVGWRGGRHDLEGLADGGMEGPSGIGIPGVIIIAGRIQRGTGSRGLALRILFQRRKGLEGGG